MKHPTNPLPVPLRHEIHELARTYVNGAFSGSEALQGFIHGCLYPHPTLKEWLEGRGISSTFEERTAIRKEWLEFLKKT